MDQINEPMLLPTNWSAHSQTLRELARSLVPPALRVKNYMAGTLLAVYLIFNSGNVAYSQTQIWIQQFGTTGFDGVGAAAPDGVGGVFVGGGTIPVTGQPFNWITHYTPNGLRSWIQRFNIDQNDDVRGATSDDAGGAYFVGATSNSSTGNRDAWIARVDPMGAMLWLQRFDIGGHVVPSQWVGRAAPDGQGGVYICGETTASLGGANVGLSDAWVARYDGAGVRTWIRQLGTLTFDAFSAAATDGSGGVYLVGSTDGSLGGPQLGGEDIVLARYDSFGTQMWIRQFGTSAGESADAAAPDGQGGVFVAGWSEGSLGHTNAGGRDVILSRYDGAGNQIWVRQFGSPGNDITYTATSDGLGGVYIGGVTRGALAGHSAGLADAWCARYDGDGNLLWIVQPGSFHEDNLTTVVHDGLGSIYIGGETLGNIGGPNYGWSDAWFARYDGGLLYTRYCAPTASNSTGHGAVIEALGSNFIAASNLVLSAHHLPVHCFGYFLTSETPGLVPGAGGSQGTLCIGGTIGRFVGAGQVMSSGASGSFSLPIDLGAMPTPTGFVAVQAAETWNFQAWYRDANPGVTSNLTDAVTVMFH